MQVPLPPRLHWTKYCGFLLRAAILLALTPLAGCYYFSPKPVGIGPEVKWENLPGWNDDRHAEAWPALLQTCKAKRKAAPPWPALCAAAEALGEPDDTSARQFFEQWFRPHRVLGAWGRARGLITGYYEPLLQGSLKPSPGFPVALHRRPPDLITVELADLYPELAGKRVRGRLTGHKLVPYYSRADINDATAPLAGNELLWVNDPVAAFFLHIQGSGRVTLTDGRVVGVGYADQNGYPYTAIGRRLVEMGEMELDNVNLFTLRAWLRSHPQRATELLNSNASYVFFQLRDAPADGPIGSLNVPLTAERSLAVDRKVIPLGIPVWLDTSLPGDTQPYRRLLLAQDTGGAISGPVRADLFFGHGERAEDYAGRMKQEGRLFALLPVADERSEHD